jgi:uncharacterized protein YggE
VPEDLNAEVQAPAAESGRARTKVGRRVTVGVAVSALLVGGAGLGLAVSQSGASTIHPVTCSGTTPKLTVQGTGQANGTPDVLTLVLQVNATGGSATAALSDDNAKVGAAVLALLAGGVAKQDIQTTGLTLQTQYAYPKGVPTITGYQVANTVTAAMHDVAKAGTAIDDVVGATGNAAQINSLTFSFDNPAQVEDQARASAVRQAVSHAHAMAEAAGRKLGPVCSLTDNTQPQLFEPEFGAGTPEASSANLGAVPIESGTQAETDQVTLVYALG